MQIIFFKQSDNLLSININPIIEQKYGGLRVLLEDSLVEEGEIFAVSYVDIGFSLRQEKITIIMLKFHYLT